MSGEDDDLDPLVQEALSFSETAPKLGLTPVAVADSGAAKMPSRATAFLLAWKRGKENLFLEGGVPWGQLPRFAELYLRLLWDTNEFWAMRAIAIGDVSFFVAWLLKLDQIDLAMLDAGMTLADRSALIRFRASVDGYREVAEKRLKRLGGVWPPAPIKSPTDSKKR